MTNEDMVAEVRADLRLILDPTNKPVQVGSPLWERLRTHRDDYGWCSECGLFTENFDTENEDWICLCCCAEIVAGQREDQRLDDPRRGQAEWINGQR